MFEKNNVFILDSQDMGFGVFEWEARSSQRMRVSSSDTSFNHELLKRVNPCFYSASSVADELLTF